MNRKITGARLDDLRDPYLKLSHIIGIVSIISIPMIKTDKKIKAVVSGIP